MILQCVCQFMNNLNRQVFNLNFLIFMMSSEDFIVCNKHKHCKASCQCLNLKIFSNSSTIFFPILEYLATFFFFFPFSQCFEMNPPQDSSEGVELWTPSRPRWQAIRGIVWAGGRAPRHLGPPGPVHTAVCVCVFLFTQSCFILCLKFFVWLLCTEAVLWCEVSHASRVCED